jgi:hypothetical protein
MDAISRNAVLGALGNGCRTIWDLASLFQVSAADVGLRSVVYGLVDAGAVTASTGNLYSATLSVTQSLDVR